MAPGRQFTSVARGLQITGMETSLYRYVIKHSLRGQVRLLVIIQ